MSPTRKETVNGRTVAEYWWAGKLVVYVGHHAVFDEYDSVCSKLRNWREPSFIMNGPPKQCDLCQDCGCKECHPEGDYE